MSELYRFDSILVRLNGATPARTSSRRCKSSCFNSILVRLKADVYAPGSTTHGMFQFHTGAIKSRLTHTTRSSRTGFNSILVRLKVSQRSPLTTQIQGFNSILVRLKVTQYIAEADQSLHPFCIFHITCRNCQDSQLPDVDRCMSQCWTNYTEASASRL